jgi:hypothetical protein
MRQLLILLIIGALLVSCSQATKGDNSNSKIITELENMGYKVVDFNTEHDTITLTKRYLLEFPNTIHWALQDVNIEELLNKEVSVYKATVKGHYLDKELELSSRTKLHLYIIEDELIGGISFPEKEAMGGGYYSLKGKTFEELHEQNYADWESDLKEKLKTAN